MFLYYKFAFSGFHVSGITQYMVLCICPLSRNVFEGACVGSGSLFLSSILLCGYTTFLYVCSQAMDFGVVSGLGLFLSLVAQW